MSDKRTERGLRIKGGEEGSSKFKINKVTKAFNLFPSISSIFFFSLPSSLPTLPVGRQAAGKRFLILQLLLQSRNSLLHPLWGRFPFKVMVEKLHHSSA